MLPSPPACQNVFAKPNPSRMTEKFLCLTEISIAPHGAQGENLRKTDAEEEIGTDKTIRADLLCVKTQLIPK